MSRLEHEFRRSPLSAARQMSRRSAYAPYLDQREPAPAGRYLQETASRFRLVRVALVRVGRVEETSTAVRFRIERLAEVEVRGRPAYRVDGQSPVPAAGAARLVLI